MNRLQIERHRLYLTPASTRQDAVAGEPRPIDASAVDACGGDVVPSIDALAITPIDTAASGAMIDAVGQVRALVLELARPAAWPVLSTVWNAVQTDLELPAPAIAVNGRDGFQLWFSLAQSVAAARGLALLEALCQRYLADVKPQRLALLPLVDATSALPTRHADPVPALQPASAVWSAFVAQDLAPMFADEPWLDLPPNVDGQAKLLARLKSIQPTEFDRALELLGSVPAPVLKAAGAPATPESAPASTCSALTSTSPIDIDSVSRGELLEPKAFLQGVMSDPRVPLALRIEAAKALLTCAAPSVHP